MLPVIIALLVENIRKMLEACRYTGFSNFDIKYSGIPGDYRVFEINLFNCTSYDRFVAPSMM